MIIVWNKAGNGLASISEHSVYVSIYRTSLKLYFHQVNPIIASWIISINVMCENNLFITNSDITFQLFYMYHTLSENDEYHKMINT